MKKILVCIFAYLSIIIMMPIVNAKSDVTVYMFTKNGCTYCESAREYFEGLLKEDKDAFNLVNIEVWCGTDYVTNPDSPTWILGSEDAYTLLQKVFAHFELDEQEMGTPVIVIGDYVTIGFPKDKTQELTDAIDKAKKSKKTIDVVQDLAKENNIDLASIEKDFGVASCDKTTETSTDTAKSSGKYDAIIIVSIFVVLIGGFAGLVFLGRKK